MTIEKVIFDYLDTTLTDATVLMEVPEIPSADYPAWPEKLVLIERVGGTKENHISHASIAFQSYASSLAGAVNLDDEVRTAVDALGTAIGYIGRCTLASCYNHTDTRTGRYRYQSIYEIYYNEIDMEEQHGE